MQKDEYDREFVDVGSGSTGVSCVKQCVVSWLTRKTLSDGHFVITKTRNTDEELDYYLK